MNKDGCTNGGLNACVKALGSTSCGSTTSSGFESYWEIPAAGSDTTSTSKWVKGPGYKLFAAGRKSSVI